MRGRLGWRIWLAAGLLLAGTAGQSSAVIVASSADDICGPAADPCVITQTVKVADGSVLDFGTRAVEIRSGGLLDIGDGTVFIRCGDFTASVGAKRAIDARETDGGSLTVQARRACSAQLGRACISDGDCLLGTCSVTVCSQSSGLVCVADDDCQFGSCGVGGMCSGNPSIRCSVDSDCQFGSCSVQACSSNPATSCAGDVDCNLGTCSQGNGNISLDGKILAQGDIPGSIVLRAAGEISIEQLLDVHGTTTESDGGELEVDSTNGSIVINGKLDASAGSESTGGDIGLFSGRDITVHSLVDADGGDFDGGGIEIDADGNVSIDSDLSADAIAGEGFGGEIAVTAGGDITLSGLITLGTTGHRSLVDDAGGDGGTQEYKAQGDINVGPNVKMLANGAAPDGFGDDVSIVAGGNVVTSGDIQARAKGKFGGGGSATFESGGLVQVDSSASVDVSGGDGDAGDVDVSSGGNTVWQGAIDASAGNGGVGGSVTMSADADMSVGGNILVGGDPTRLGNINGSTDLEACRIDLVSGTLIDNRGSYGENLFIGHERITLQSGSRVLADAATGTNSFSYRDPNKPPTINGTVSPAAGLFVNSALIGCPVCGNAEVDQGETCDDGNLIDGDGCSADCQLESCIAETPGYPDVPLCDDGMTCTVDSCNTTTGSCDHVVDCDDNLACTSDRCDAAGLCQHVPNDAVCGDGNPCSDDVCTQVVGCTHPTNTSPCEDGLFCTAADVCAGGVCRAGAPVDCSALDDTCNRGVCDEAAGSCATNPVNEGGSCDDGDVCTAGDVCSAGQCGGLQICESCGNGVVEGTEQCDDGDTSWQAGQACRGDCTLLVCGNPDDSSSGTTASDALFTLRAAVGLASCDLCICDANNSGTVTAGDALALLRSAVRLPVTIQCPVCP